jgi:hypothetical protein
MKKQVLFIALLTTGISFGQSLTSVNEPQIGDAASMFLCDSFATNYANVTGSGVTWDYSQIAGYAGETRTLSIVDATTTQHTGVFPGATKAVVIENFLTTYWESSATERTSPGFVFSEPSFGDVISNYSTDDQLLANYPFELNDYLADTYAGTLSFSFNGLPVSPDATGVSSAKVDGTGTLKLNATTTITGVLRYVIIDTLFTSLPIVGDVELIRQQYEYYAHSVSNMPVFTHTYTALQPIGGEPITAFTVVLSLVEPSNTVSTSEVSTEIFSVYPNPVADQLKVTGNFAGETVAVMKDQSGKEVARFTAIQNGSVISTADLEAGVYFLSIGSLTQKFIKK